ncbi:MAG: response regulator [Chromatiales bacterium]|jgi:two-component system response regulator RpfG
MSPDSDSKKTPLRPLVIIVDDQLTGRKIMEELVRSIDASLEVETFADPYEALDRIAEVAPDLVLTDYKMPTMNGVSFTRNVRSVPGCADVPIVVVTVLDDRSIRYQALDAGATDFLTRPIDQIECRARCRNLLTLRKQQKIIRNRATWLEEQVSVATREIRAREEEALVHLARLGEYRDTGPGDHVLRIARYARLLGEQLGLSEPACEELELAAPLHDIGKIGMPDQILNKPGPLTNQEWGVMQTHATLGYELLKDSRSRTLRKAAMIAAHHHERFDGTGYPSGLSGESIPIESRITAVADVFDALISVRPYKGAWTVEAAVRYVREQSGQHFDPACVEAFDNRLEEILDVQARFPPEPPSDPDAEG